MTPKERKMRKRVENTIDHANIISGKGDVVKVVWKVPYTGQGIAVRQMQYGMDAVNFHLTDGGVKFLGKIRIILPLPKR